MSGLIVVVPLKPFDRAKSRLGSGYDDATRARIAESLARNVLSVVFRAFPDARRYVLGERSLTAFADDHGAELLEERSDLRGLGPKLDAALDALDWDTAIVVMGDLPDAREADLVAIANADADVVLAEGADGHGTNAIRIAGPRRIDLAFAETASCDVHEARARAAGMRVARLRLESLARDLDRPSDLTAVEAARIGREPDR